MQQKPLKSSISALFLALALTSTNALSVMAQDYASTFRDGLMNRWNDKGPGKVNATFKVLADGTVTGVSVKDEKGNKAAEAYALKQLSSYKGAPMPAELRGKPHAWMFFDWHDTTKALSGPYFNDRQPSWLEYKIGTKKRPYDDTICKKIQDQIDAAKVKSKGSAKVYLKVKPDGTIAKIFVVTKPKNASDEKTAYAIVSRSHPYGPITAKFAGSPFFEVGMNWESNGNSVFVRQLKKPPQWLK